MDTPGIVPLVAYFSMEIALESDVPTYSGGLGVLAGDTLRSAADLGIPMVAVTLASRSGYFRQRLEAGRQQEQVQPWEPATRTERAMTKVGLRIGGREVWVGAWIYRVEGRGSTARPVQVLLLDTDMPENHDEDRLLTHHLYGRDELYRLRQEIVLGIGGVRMLAALGLEIGKYHLNEGHAAFLTVELLRRELAAPLEPDFHQAVHAVRKRCLFTTHTPVPAGHDQFDWQVARRELGDLLDSGPLREIAGAERLNMTRLALSLSGWVNGVAQRHAEVSRAMFPGYEVHAITNGVHSWTWASDAHRRLFDRHIPHWCQEPEFLVHAANIPLDELRAAHAEAKAALLEHASRFPSGRRLEPARFTIGFARRMTSYKRPHLLFSDLQRLRRIARQHPLQVVLAGKAHPRDLGGKRHIEGLHAAARELEDVMPVVFLPDYDMQLGRLIVSGVDLWLNTPQRPLEASGTSGMKAALNGVPNLSVLDGWWLEGWQEGVTGWAVGDDGPDDARADAESLYQKLEHAVLPLYRDRPDAWQEVARHAISLNASFFNTHRMLRRYLAEAYAR